MIIIVFRDKFFDFVNTINIHCFQHAKRHRRKRVIPVQISGVHIDCNGIIFIHIDCISKDQWHSNQWTDYNTYPVDAWNKKHFLVFELLLRFILKFPGNRMCRKTWAILIRNAINKINSPINHPITFIQIANSMQWACVDKVMKSFWEFYHIF